MASWIKKMDISLARKVAHILFYASVLFIYSYHIYVIGRVSAGGVLGLVSNVPHINRVQLLSVVLTIIGIFIVVNNYKHKEKYQLSALATIIGSTGFVHITRIPTSVY